MCGLLWGVGPGWGAVGGPPLWDLPCVGEESTCYLCVKVCGDIDSDCCCGGCGDGDGGGCGDDNSDDGRRRWDLTMNLKMEMKME